MLAWSASLRNTLRQRIIRLALIGRRADVRWFHSFIASCAVAALAFASLTLASACTSATAPMVKLHGVPAGRFEQQLNEACGKPIAYPLSSRCITLMGSAGPMLEHRSVLVMKIWRSCPHDNPCYRIITSDPACTGQTVPAVSDHGATVNDACLRAQQANYSCAALRDDLTYLERSRQVAAPPDDDCEVNKNNLSEYDKRIEEMSVRIQWYRIFAAKGF